LKYFIRLRLKCSVIVFVSFFELFNIAKKQRKKFSFITIKLFQNSLFNAVRLKVKNIVEN
jgi:hypothetical protein